MTTNNLHRELAPISAAAWEQIEEEASRTFRTRVAGRKAVDVPDAAGFSLPAIGSGHLVQAEPIAGVAARVREVQPLIELRAPFRVTRAAVDDVLRGAEDSDWQPVKDAAEALAAAEDTLVFTGKPDAGVTGIIPASDNPHIALGGDPLDLPDATAKAITALRTVGVQGPYSLLLSTELYSLAGESVDHGYPIITHLRRILGDDGDIIFAPALDGAVLVSTRGGDYTLTLGQDVSIGYLSHDADSIELYLQESVTFRVNTTEASVVLPTATTD